MPKPKPAPRPADQVPPNVRMMPLASLEAAAYNPRTITPEALDGLKASIETFGLVQPIVWNERSWLSTSTRTTSGL